MQTEGASLQGLLQRGSLVPSEWIGALVSHPISEYFLIKGLPKDYWIMLFVVHFEDVYMEQLHRIAERTERMDAHLEFLNSRSSQVIAAGALRLSVDGLPVGGIWIVEAEDEAAVDTLYRADPFWKAGLRKSVCVCHWAAAYWSPAFVSCIALFRQ